MKTKKHIQRDLERELDKQRLAEFHRMEDERKNSPIRVFLRDWLWFATLFISFVLFVYGISGDVSSVLFILASFLIAKQSIMEIRKWGKPAWYFSWAIFWFISIVFTLMAIWGLWESYGADMWDIYGADFMDFIFWIVIWVITIPIAIFICVFLFPAVKRFLSSINRVIVWSLIIFGGFYLHPILGGVLLAILVSWLILVAYQNQH